MTYLSRARPGDGRDVTPVRQREHGAGSPRRGEVRRSGRITKSGRQPPSRSTPGPATRTVPGRRAATDRLKRPHARPDSVSRVRTDTPPEAGHLLVDDR